MDAPIANPTHEAPAGSNPDGSQSIDFDLGLLIHILRNSWYWMVLILALFMGGAFTYIHYTQPVYEASSVIQIVKENQANRLLNVQEFRESEDISKDIELLRSEEFFKRVIENLDLSISYYAEGEILRNERFRNSPYDIKYANLDPLLYDRPIYIEFETENNGTITLPRSKDAVIPLVVGDTVEAEGIVFQVTDRFISNFLNSPDYGENSYFFTINTPFANLRSLYPNYRIDLLNASAKTVRITVQNNDAAKAATIADRIAAEYMEYDKERQSQSALKILKFINEQLGEVYTRLKDSESLIRDFKKENRLADNDDIARTYINRLNDLEQDKAALQIHVDLLKQLKKNIDRENTGVDINELMPVLAGSEFEQKVESQIVRLQDMVMRRNNQLTSATQENPTIMIYDQQIETQKTLILRSLDALEEKFMNGVNTTSSKIDEIEQNFVNLPSKEIEYARLERVFNSNEKYYTLLLEKKTEYSISEAGFVSENRGTEQGQDSTRLRQSEKSCHLPFVHLRVLDIHAAGHRRTLPAQQRTQWSSRSLPLDQSTDQPTRCCPQVQ